MLTLIAITFIALTLITVANAASPAEKVARAVTATWGCQDAIGQPRTKTGNLWAKHSPGYRRWQLRQWQARLDKCNATRGVIRTLQRGLANTPMSGTEAALEAAGRRHGISPVFMAAVAGTESSYGAAACRNNRMNVWGLSSCGSGWYVPQWQSWAQAFDFYARFLVTRWPGASTPYSFRGYAACSDCWARKVSEHMARFGVGNSVAYP